MRKTLLQFIIGLVMLVVGGYLFLSSVSVVTSVFGLTVGRTHINGGLIIIPFLAGVIWLFIEPKSIGAKIVAVAGLLIIIAAVISSINLVLRNINLYELLVMLILLIGGGVLTLRALFDKEK